MSEQHYVILTMAIYLLAMVGLGIAAYKRTKSLDDYMLGGRDIGPIVGALSVGASDMSGWLLMGLPGAIYVSGLIEGWIAVGLTIGAFLNWKFVAPRLRSYTKVSSDSITIPSFLGSRVRDKSRIIRVTSGIIIMVFFTFYVSSGMVAGGVFFESSLGYDYLIGMLVVAGVTVLYTLVGGFLAVSWTDVVQGTMMLLALVLVPLVGVMHVGGPAAMIDEIQAVGPHLLNPIGDPAAFSWLTIVSILSAVSWGLGYFGQPHILVRFMALRTVGEVKSARRFGIGWMILSLIGAVFTALVGIAVYHHDQQALPDPEAVFITLGQLLFHPLIAGFMLAAILAAIMSTISSQLLVTSSAIVEDVYHAFTSRDIRSGLGVVISRLSVLAVALVACALSWEQNETILDLVAFAWAGFGSAFGPVILLSLYWRKLTKGGVLTGMLVGAITVGIWGSLDGGVFDVYEMLPGFTFALLSAVAVSLATYRPDAVIESEFDEMTAEVETVPAQLNSN